MLNCLADLWGFMWLEREQSKKIQFVFKKKTGFHQINQIFIIFFKSEKLPTLLPTDDSNIDQNVET